MYVRVISTFKLALNINILISTFKSKDEFFMKPGLLDLLGCPSCKGDLLLRSPHMADGEIESGQLVCNSCSKDYPILAFVPRFVSPDNYAVSFGIQWNHFRKTQLDSCSGLSISADRFLASTGWSPEALAGKTVLDVGCGAGRFAEVALSFGATVVALDYSSAVDACYQNLGSNPGINIVQGDAYHLPFKPERFDFVYCLGVLQHTPDPAGAFESLPEQLRPGGQLAVDVYPRLAYNLLWSKYWFRPFTKRMYPIKLFRLVQILVRVLLPLSTAVGRVPFIGRKLRYLIPVVNYEGVYPLTGTQIKEWCIMETFDMLAPAHDHPQSEQTLKSWLKRSNLKDIEVIRLGHIVGRGTK